MANQSINEPKDYSEVLRLLETSDPSHADTFNPLFERLVNNDAFLKNGVDQLQESRATKTEVQEIRDDLESVAIQQEETASYRTLKSGKDAEGIFTTVERRRKSDNTLAVKSVLSGGTTPKYTTRTVRYYGPDGETVTKTDVFALSYDADGVLISEV